MADNQFDKIPEVAADGEPTLGDVGAILNRNFDKTLVLYLQRNPETGTLSEQDLPPKPQAEVIADVFDGIENFDLASPIDLKLVIRGGVLQFVPDTGGTAAPAAPTALARMQSDSHRDADNNKIFVQGHVTIQSWQNSIDLYGVYTAPAGNPVAFRWHLVSKPAGSMAVMHAWTTTPDERLVQDTFCGSMDLPGLYELELTVTDTVTGLSGRSELNVTKL